MNRPSWDEYFMKIAEVVASRATCPRASVGAVIVKNNRILATGYNGALPVEKHCTEIGCQVVDNHCLRAIHAETNAVAQAARICISIEHSRLYYYDSKKRPHGTCSKCEQLTKAAGIDAVYFLGDSGMIEATTNIDYSRIPIWIP